MVTERPDHPQESSNSFGGQDSNKTSESPALHANAVRVGAALRQAREEKGFSLEETAKQTHIRHNHLIALESGDVASLPGATFALGFLRLYAQFLGLPDAELVKQFTTDLNHAGEFNAHFFPPPGDSSSRSPGKVLVLVGVVVFIFLFIAYEKFVADDPSENPPLPSVQHTLQKKISPNAEKSSDASAPMTKPIGEDVDGEISEQLSDALASEANLSDADLPEDMAQPVDEPSDLQISSSSVGRIASEASKPSVEKSVQGNDTGSGLSLGNTVTLLAREKVWVQIQNQDGQVIKDMVMKPGHQFQVPENGLFFATLGNAGGIRIWVGEKEIPPLGKQGRVIRNLDLSARALLARSSEAQ
ncbi:MAG: helix-turn-helix domain-containing protein [Magnetococcales bacterium]|nr:helix-turn-helix domain-containing protein [Magnetococcales bacterium]